MKSLTIFRPPHTPSRTSYDHVCHADSALQMESAARPVCPPDGNSMSNLKHMVGKDVHTLILTCAEFVVSQKPCHLNFGFTT